MSRLRDLPGKCPPNPSGTTPPTNGAPPAAPTEGALAAGTIRVETSRRSTQHGVSRPRRRLPGRTRSTARSCCRSSGTTLTERRPSTRASRPSGARKSPTAQAGGPLQYRRQAGTEHCRTATAGRFGPAGAVLTASSCLPLAFGNGERRSAATVALAIVPFRASRRRRDDSLSDSMTSFTRSSG